MTMSGHDLNRAKALLEAIKTALPHADGIYKATNDWVAGEDPPPLLKFSGSYQEAVDTKTLEQFKTLVAFMTDAVFGVDCDHDSAVRFAFVDQGREENLLPFWRIKRVDDVDGSLEDRLRQMELMQNVADSAQAKADHMKKFLDEDIKAVVRREALHRAAKECEPCKGKGWVKATKKDIEGFYYGIYCENWGIGAYRNGPFRFPCHCQDERKLNGWPLKPVPEKTNG
jgi:hypothetical protein